MSNFAKTGQEKFDTCRFRSHSPVPMGTVACCAKQIKEGYLCWEKHVNMEDVSPAICEKCIYYISKYITNKE